MPRLALWTRVEAVTGPQRPGKTAMLLFRVTLAALSQSKINGKPPTEANSDIIETKSGNCQ